MLWNMLGLLATVTYKYNQDDQEGGGAWVASWLRICLRLGS